MKHISILGSTGSIGTQTLEIVRNNPDKFKIVGLTTNKNSDLLIKQIKEFKPIAVAIMNAKNKDDVLNFSSCQVYTGMEGLKKITKKQQKKPTSLNYKICLIILKLVIIFIIYRSQINGYTITNIFLHE